MGDILQTWLCHKKVKARKIVKEELTRNGATLTFDSGDKFTVADDYVSKHRISTGFSGGYFVEYEDGYQSWSPSEAFEGGYTLVA